MFYMSVRYGLLLMLYVRAGNYIFGGVGMRKDMNEDAACVSNDRYDAYYNQVLIKEQPFYHVGMTAKEAASELKYLNENLDSFYAGTYMPLWRQNLYK